MLRILHLEDNPADAELAWSLLKSEGIACDVHLVHSREEFVEALGKGEFDLIVSDYRLPSFDGMAALKIVRRINPDTPFIFLSGVMGEDAAIEGLLCGATDYVLKEKMGRFVPAVRRAVAEADSRRERKKAEEAAQKITEMKSEFASMVSHELRTPLTVIKEGVEIVFDGTDGALNDSQKHHLELAMKSIERMRRLIDNILNYQRLESGSMAFDMKPCDMGRLIEGALEEMEPMFQKKDLELEKKVDPSLSLVCDKDKIEEVLVNLLGNALKFTEKGVIRISARQAGQWIEICIQDEGIGIRPEDQPKLFHSFSQIENHKGKKGGTGLGLAICKKIIERHNGRIQVQSVFGEGSTFSIYLPIQDAMERPSSGGQILIVDDETDVIDLVGARLSKAGYEVLVAGDGQEALNMLSRYRPRLVLLDYRMPAMDGHEVCRRMKEDSRLRAIPIIFVTASPQAATPEILRSIGADDYLIKPFHVPELFEKIDRHLR